MLGNNRACQCYSKNVFFLLPAFLTQACPEGINVHEWDSGPMQGAIPTQSHNLLAVRVDYSTRVYDPYSFWIVMWVLLRPTRTNQGKCCETGLTVFHRYLRRLESLRQYFLHSYFKTLSVGPTSCSAAWCSTNRANQLAVSCIGGIESPQSNVNSCVISPWHEGI